MTDHKFTDEEVIEGLKCCGKFEPCGDCPYTAVEDCAQKNTADAIAIIKRQKAEIEEQDQAIIKSLKRMGEIRAEAIKEFADKLKEFAYTAPNWTSSVLVRVVDIEDMYNLVEEMIGGDKR